MIEDVLRVFVDYKKRFDGNRPSYRQIAAALGVHQQAVKNAIDGDNRFKWVESDGRGRELILEGGSWSYNPE